MIAHGRPRSSIRAATWIQCWTSWPRISSSYGRFWFWIEALGEQARLFAFEPAEPFEPTRWLGQGDRVDVGEVTLQVRHCPGHTPGHVIFFNEPARFAIVGDVLFKGSIGRTDFPMGNHADLINAITGKLWPLGGETMFVPGHGEMSSFAYERATNPYVADSVRGKA